MRLDNFGMTRLRNIFALLLALLARTARRADESELYAPTLWGRFGRSYDLSRLQIVTG